jgi:hypothetical protein
MAADPLKLVKKETIASVRDVYRELNAEVDRYNEGIKKSDTLEGQLQRTLTTNLQTHVKIGIELADNNQITAAHLTDIGSLTEQIRTGQLDIVELAQLQTDLEEKLSSLSQERGDAIKERTVLLSHEVQLTDRIQKMRKAGNLEAVASLEAERAGARHEINVLDVKDRSLKQDIETLTLKKSIADEAHGTAVSQKQITDRMEKQKDVTTILDKVTGGMASKVAAFKDNFTGANKKIMGTAAILGLVVGLMVAIAAQTDQVGNEFGVIGVKDFQDDLMGATAEAQRLGYDFAEVATLTNELSSNFGMAIDEATDLSGEVLGVSRALNISVSDSAKLIGNLQATTSLSAEGAANLIKQTGALARSAGIAPKAIFADMAGATEEIAGYTDASGENIAQAAVAARAMGISLSDVTKIADDLLNVETSIGKEMEAEIMLGRDLNLDRARQLALSGELAELQEEILGQVGTEAEFNAMNVLERKALAGAIGISVSQLGKMVTEAGKSKEELMSIRSMDMSEIVPEDAISAITRMTNKFKALGTQLLSVIATVSDKIGAWWTLIGAGVLLLLGFFAKTAIKMGIQIFMQKLYKKSIDSTNESLSTQAEGGKKGGGMKSLFGGMKPMDMIKGAVAILILAGALVVAAFAFQMFGDVTWPAVFMGITALGAMTIAAMVLGKVGTEVIKGAIAVAILGVALIPAAYAFGLLAGVDPMSIIAFAGSIIVLSAAMFALGFFLLSGGFILFGAGIAGLLSLGAAVMVLGIGMSLAAPYLGTFTTFLTGLASTMETVQPQIDTMDLLSDSLFGLAGALTAVGVAGIFALPAFSILKGLGLLGGGEEAAAGEESVSLVKDDVVSGQLQSVINAINEMKAQVTMAINDSPRQIGKETSRGLLSGVGI